MAEAAAPSGSEFPDRDRLRQIGRRVRKRLAAHKSAQRILADNAELWAVSHFFDAAECDRLMSMIDLVARPSTSYGLSHDKDARTSSTGDLDPRDPFIRRLELRIDDLLGLDHATGEPMEGQRYEAGQYFKPHIDWFPPDSPGWQREHAFGGQRAITAMIYLNSLDEGGETDFPRLDIAVKPRLGTLLVWNNAAEDGTPNPWTVHSGNPVLRGTKYVITKWYRCHRARRPS